MILQVFPFTHQRRRDDQVAQETQLSRRPSVGHTGMYGLCYLLGYVWQVSFVVNIASAQPTCPPYTAWLTSGIPTSNSMVFSLCRMRNSRTFARMEVTVMALQLFLSKGSLPPLLHTGGIEPHLNMSGIATTLFSNYVSTAYPPNFRCSASSPSAPQAFLTLSLRSACSSSSSVKGYPIGILRSILIGCRGTEL